MSLLSERMVSCCRMTPTYTTDADGGRSVSWTAGDTFNASLTFDSSEANTEAERETAKDLFTVTTVKTVVLQFHDVFKRLSDDKIFRVITNGDENQTPASACLNMRQVTAERWELT